MSALPAFSAAGVAEMEAEEEAPSHSSIPDLPLPASAKVTVQPRAALAPSATRLAASFNSLMSPSPATSFQAQPMMSNFPPDTMGAVSSKYAMSVSNDEIVVQNRSGGVLSSTNLNAFWDAAFPAAQINPAWDPNLRYDPYNDRWVFVCMGAYSYAGSSMLIAVSATGDPTGTWYLRRFQAAANTTFDHPRVGFNANWIVVTGNELDDTNNLNWVYSVVYVFDKADFYANGSKAPATFTTTQDFTLTPALTYDNTVGTMYMMANYNGANGSLSLSTITGSVDDPTANFNVAFPTTSNTWASTVPSSFNQNFAPQLGSSQDIGVFDARMNTVVYRNGSLWATHTVFVPAGTPTISAVDWWQIGTDGSVQQFGRLQDPNGVYFYTYPSLAVNANGDMLVGYSRMAATEYASAAYAFRAANDAPGTLRGEYLMQSGEASYVKLLNQVNRWGDYSATQVDPVNDMDFWTIQEYAGPNDYGSTWGMWWARITDPVTPLPTLQALSLNPTSVTGGQSSTGTVTLNSAAPSGGVTVNLSSGNAAAQLPSSVVVPQGATSANFSITTTTVSSSTPVAISASYNGGTSSAQLTVLPPLALQAISLNPALVAGGQSSTGTVTLSYAAPSGGTTVNLSSGNAVAQLPSSVVIPQGATSANFSITTSTVSSSTPVTISATYNGGAVSGQLTVAPSLSWAASTTSVTLQPGASTTITLNLVSSNYAGTVSFGVATSSSAITASAPPVTLAAGQSASSTLTISASTHASTHSPALPWKSGGAIAFAVLLAPLGLRKRPLLAVLCVTIAISAASLISSCATDPPRPVGPRSYTVTVTPNSTPAASPALSPVVVNVTVQ